MYGSKEVDYITWPLHALCRRAKVVRDSPPHEGIQGKHRKKKLKQTKSMKPDCTNIGLGNILQPSLLGPVKKTVLWHAKYATRMQMKYGGGIYGNNKEYS